MPKYEILGGGHVTATTDLGLVSALREDAQQWVPSVSIEDYMEGFARRAKMQKGVDVRISSLAEFVSDLKEFGFVTEVATSS